MEKKKQYHCGEHGIVDCRTVVESGVSAPCGYLSTIQSGAVAARVGKTSTFDLDFNQLRETPAGHLSVSSLLEHTGVHRQRHSDQVVERG